MKKRTLLMLLGCLAAIAGIVWVVNREFPAVQQVSHADTPEVISRTEKSASKAATELASATSHSLAEAPALPVPNPAAMTAKIKETTIERLMDLSANEDSASLSTILMELENPDKEIREAALEAAIQFGERTNTIARLTELAQRTEDEAERTALREAIEFIKLPSLTEVLSARKAAGLPAGAVKSRQPPLASTARMPKASLAPRNLPPPAADAK
jgi:uncharacterized protein YdiU (UPF0061 family)